MVSGEYSQNNFESVLTHVDISLIKPLYVCFQFGFKLKKSSLFCCKTSFNFSFLLFNGVFAGTTVFQKDFFFGSI